MKVLMIGTDRKIFEEGSDARSRMIEYGSLVDELSIIVFSLKNLRLKKQKISPNINIYPTNSSNKWLYIKDAISIGKRLVGFDLVTAQDSSESGLVAYRLSKKFKAKLQLQVHGDIMSKRYANESVLNKIRIFMAKQLLSKANCVRVVSERIKKSLKNLTSAPILVLPIFVDQITTESIHRKKKFNKEILIVSRLAPEKHISLAVDVLSEVKDKIEGVGLVIVGDGPEQNHIEKYAKLLGISDRVMFEGWQNDLGKYYSSADMYLLTSDHEGYARTLVEAAISGCPVVTTDVGLVGDVLKHEESALVSPPGNSGGLSKQVEQVLTDGALRDKLIAGAYMAIKTHMPKNKEKYLEMYKQSWETCDS